MFKSWSLKLKITLFGLSLMTAVLGVLIWSMAHFIRESTLSQVRLSLSETSQLLNLAIVPYATDTQVHILQDYLNELVGSHSSLIKYIIISNGQKIMLKAGNVPLTLPAPQNPDNLKVVPDIIHVRQRILFNTDDIGYLQYGYQTTDMTLYRAALIRNASLGLFLVLTLALLSITLLGHRLGQRLRNLNAAFMDIANGDYSRRVPIDNHDELSRLAILFNRMTDAVEERWRALLASRAETQSLNSSLEKNVEQRTQQLREANRSLQNVVDELQRAQKQLVQSEKLAALGQLVAGVAHELGTPLGNALLIATSIEEQDRSFQSRAETGNISRIEFMSLLDTHQQSLDLLVRSLNRAASLISSFKQIAVDQISDQRRSFPLERTIHETITSMEPTYRKFHVRISLDIESDILMDSYPGALIQIFSNFINNTVLHAFDHIIEPNIHIAAHRQGDQVMITFTDNGTGIPQENLKRLFEPFFTTRMGNGGTGLGLHICYNLVTATLGGEISVASTLGQGTTFTLILPLIAPRHAEKSLSVVQQIES
ncbi:MAG: HAMP domain-containing histidine kinase [Pseudomonadales bacterium]|nr:HAMP domain-containing histidine kinase [Pseudomonadales bacterium]